MEESNRVSMEHCGDTVAILENSIVSSDIRSAGTLLISLASKNRHTSSGLRRIFGEEKVMLAECLEKGIGSPGFKRFHIEAIRQAVRFLNLEVAESLLVGDSSLDLLCDDHEVLYLALRNGDDIPRRWDNELLHQMMSLLISHGAAVNANSPDGETALFLTCDYGFPRAFQILFQAGADHSTLHRLELVKRNDSESTSDSGRTSELNLLQVALNARLRDEREGRANDEYTESYHTEIWGPIIQCLYGAGLRTARNDASLVKFLHVVCHLGRKDYVELVLRHGVDVHAKAARVDSRDTVYGSALHAAAAGGHQDIVRRLLDYGADPRAARLQEYMKSFKTDEFITPIAAALKSRRSYPWGCSSSHPSSFTSQEVLDACEAILEAGTSEADRKLLVVAVAKEGNVQMLNRLMQPGLIIDQVPLCSSIKVVKCLLDHGTAIHANELQKYAVENSLLDLFKFLVDEFGPLLTTVEELGNIDFHDAWRDKHNMILDYLIRDYSRSTFDGRSLHGDIATGLFRKFCSRLPFGQVQSILQDAVKSGCPGVYRGTLTTLATELHQLRTNRFRVSGKMTKERVRLYQLLLKFSDEAEFQKREDSSKLWLTPRNLPQYVWDHVDTIATNEASNRYDENDLSDGLSSNQCSEGHAETSVLKDHDSDQEATPQVHGDSLKNVAKTPATDIYAVSDDDMVLSSEESLIDCDEDVSDLHQADSGQLLLSGFDIGHYKRLYRESVGNTAAKSGSTSSLLPPPSSQARNSLSAKNSRFEYDQLDGSFAIRLVSIEPSNDPTAALCCHIATTNLGLYPEYEALSYVWGELPGMADITLNGFEFIITRSLWSALRRLRDPDKERRLWVDALCINQNSIPERNQQVRIMRQIYESARQTIVWVGEEADDSHLVFEHVNSWKMYANDYIAGRTKRNNEFRKAHLMPSYRGDTLAAFDRFCRRSYFYRSWVIQEVAVSNQVLVTCGRDQAELHLLLKGAPFKSGNPYDLFRGLDPAMHLRGLQELSGKRNLESILQYSRFCDATDPRDKIFGLLGLFVKPLIDVDYALDVETAFRKFTEAIIKDEQDIKFLHWFGTSQRHVHGLASWVPDYTASKPSGVLPGAYGRGYVVTAASDSLRKVLPGMQIDGSRLRIKGSHLDTILHISVTLPPHPENHPGSDSFRSIMHDWEETAATILPRKRYANSVTEVFLSTLTAGRLHHGPAKMVWYSEFGSGTLKDLENDHFNDFDVLRAWRNEEDGSDRDDAWGLSHFMDKLKDCCYGRRLFVTERGSMGLAPPSAQEGDLVVFFSGSNYPFVLRSLGDGTFAMMGDCYLYEPGRNSDTDDDFSEHLFYKNDIYRDVTEWVIR